MHYSGMTGAGCKTIGTFHYTESSSSSMERERRGGKRTPRQQPSKQRRRTKEDWGERAWATWRIAEKKGKERGERRRRLQCTRALLPCVCPSEFSWTLVAKSPPEGADFPTATALSSSGANSVFQCSTFLLPTFFSGQNVERCKMQEW